MMLSPVTAIVKPSPTVCISFHNKVQSNIPFLADGVPEEERPLIRNDDHLISVVMHWGVKACLLIQPAHVFANRLAPFVLSFKDLGLFRLEAVRRQKRDPLNLFI